MQRTYSSFPLVITSALYIIMPYTLLCIIITICKSHIGCNKVLKMPPVFELCTGNCISIHLYVTMIFSILMSLGPACY